MNLISDCSFCFTLVITILVLISTTDIECESDMEGPDFPEELTEVVKSFHDSLTQVKTQLDLLQTVPRTELYEKLDPMGRASMDLMSAYTVNSLFWMLLKTMGVNPSETNVKQELDRVKEAMKRCKEIKDKEKRGKVDQGAARRLVTSGLWEPGQAKIRGGEEERERGEDYSPPRKKIKQFDV